MATEKQRAWLDEVKAQAYHDGLQWALDNFRRYSYPAAVERIELKMSDYQQVIDHAREVRQGGG